MNALSKFAAGFLAPAVLFAAGCASITGGSSQNISVRIEAADPPVQPAVMPGGAALQPVSAPIPQPAEPQPAGKAVQPPSESIEDRLKELKRLREAGLITEEVYQDQQRRALGLR